MKHKLNEHNIKVYMVVGVPASGKSWVCNQLKDLYTYIPHDAYIKSKNQNQAYLKAIRAVLEDAKADSKPILIETPFSMSQIIEPLSDEGIDVIPVFILETPLTLTTRYFKRDGMEIPKGHLTRQNTYSDRAEDLGAFNGTSTQVLAHLKALAEKSKK